MRNIELSGACFLVLFAVSVLIFSCATKQEPSDQTKTETESSQAVDTTEAEKEVITDVTEGGKYEAFPIFRASEILQPELLRGENHEVVEEVWSDCLWNHYEINSPYGEFEATNTPELRTRINEINAIAVLKETSGAEAVVGGVVESAIQPFESAIQIAERPIETIKGIPGGVVSFFKRIYYSAERAADVAGKIVTKGAASDSGEETGESSLSEDVNYLVDWYLGTSNVERKVAKGVNVDPYTSNPVLAGEIKRVASYARYGKIGASLVPGVAFLGTINQVRQYVWNKDPRELQAFNKKELAEMGVSEEVIEKFFQSPYYSPTFQTGMVLGLEQLAGVSNREEIIEQATAATSIPEAEFMVEIVILAAWFDENQSRFTEVLENPEVPTFMTEDNRVVSIFPADYMCWSKEIAEAFQSHATNLRDVKAEKKEIWIVGEVSDRAEREISSAGFEVRGEGIVASGAMTGTEKQEAAEQINMGFFSVFSLPEAEPKQEGQ